MKQKALIIASVVLLAVSFAFAGPGEKKKPGAMHEGMNMGQCQVLTEEEQIKVQDAKRNFEKKAIPLRADAQVLRMEIDEMVLAGKTEKDISSKLGKLNEVQAVLASEKLAHQVAVRNIVGEEKYRKMGMYKKAMMGHMMGNKMQGDRDGKQACNKEKMHNNKR